MKSRHGLVLLLPMLVLGACSGNGKDLSGMPVQEKNDPVKIVIYTGNDFLEEDFNTIFTEPLKEKYPYMTIERIQSTDTKLEELIVAGNPPDIVLTNSASLKSLDALGVLMDQTSLIKQQNIDLNRFEPTVLNAAKFGSGGLYALPLSVQFNALYYNKDIFDKFGVPYPKDGMTWEETIELAKKLSRTENGVVYRGLEPESLNRMSYTKSLVYVDPETEKAAINSPAWRSIYEMMYTIYNIPNNMPANLKKAINSKVATEAFVQNRTVAMWPTVNVLGSLIEGEKEGLNWDLAQYPSYKETPNVYGTVDAHLMFVATSSKHQSEAMKIIGWVTSDEVQANMTRQTGRATPLANPAIREQFMADQPSLKTKNMAAIFKSKSAPPQILTQYDEDARRTAYTALVDYVEGKVDLNTMIRNTEEKINKTIEASKGGTTTKAEGG